MFEQETKSIIKFDKRIILTVFINLVKKSKDYIVSIFTSKKINYHKLINDHKIPIDEVSPILCKKPCSTLSYNTFNTQNSYTLPHHDMKLELFSASNFLVHLIKLGRRNINENQLQKFRLALVEVMRRRYWDHWFPEKPFKGSGYRCIRMIDKIDPMIAQAGVSVGLPPALLQTTFPSNFTMWVDPFEVSYRLGDYGSICVLYEYEEGINKPWMPNSSISCKSFTPPSQPTPPINIATLQGQTVYPPKDSLRMIDYLLDPRKPVSIEQLAAYVRN